MTLSTRVYSQNTYPNSYLVCHTQLNSYLVCLSCGFLGKEVELHLLGLRSCIPSPLHRIIWAPKKVYMIVKLTP